MALLYSMHSICNEALHYKFSSSLEEIPYVDWYTQTGWPWQLFAMDGMIFKWRPTSNVLKVNQKIKRFLLCVSSMYNFEAFLDLKS